MKKSLIHYSALFVGHVSCCVCHLSHNDTNPTFQLEDYDYSIMSCLKMTIYQYSWLYVFKICNNDRNRLQLGPVFAVAYMIPNNIKKRERRISCFPLSLEI